VRIFLIGWLVLAGFVGCTRTVPEPTSTRQAELTRMVVQMDRSVDPVEAGRLAREALTFSRELASRYRVTTTPWVHNFLVNVGLRDRGLCYQWADDLMVHLQRLHLKTLTFYPVGAHIGEYWREHNAIVVMPRDRFLPLGRAIVLDPWRFGGRLFFASVAHDRKYRWQLRKDRMLAQ
jgi:hypothetical protein